MVGRSSFSVLKENFSSEYKIQISLRPNYLMLNFWIVSQDPSILFLLINKSETHVQLVHRIMSRNLMNKSNKNYLPLSKIV